MLSTIPNPVALALLFTLLSSCSSQPKNFQVTEFSEVSRALASAHANELAEFRAQVSADPRPVDEQIKRTLERTFWAFLYAEEADADWQRLLSRAKPVSNPLDSEAYGRLLVIRGLVDEYRHALNFHYFSALSDLASSSTNLNAVENASKVIVAIDQAAQGLRGSGSPLPPGLRNWFIAHIIDKQAELLEMLRIEKLRREELGQTDASQIFHRAYVRVRASRQAFFSMMEAEFDRIRRVSPGRPSELIDSRAAARELRQLGRQGEYRAFKSMIDAAGSDMRRNFRFADREPQNVKMDKIFPSTGTAGNITGNTFPANTWSITYDDGPGTGTTTQEILTALTDRKIKATFFMLAQRISGSPNTARAVQSAGMDLASHSRTHADLSKANSDKRRDEIVVSKGEMERFFGTTFKLFRLPYGAGTRIADVRQKIVDAGMVHVFWNVDTLDWKYKNPDVVYENAKTQIDAQGRGIVLFHDIHPQTVIASTRVMDYLKNVKKAKICTTQGIVDQINRDLSSCD